MRASAPLFSYELCGAVRPGRPDCQGGESFMTAKKRRATAGVIDPPINVDPAPSERQLGLTMTTALIVGNMIGAGIFLLPALLAPFGQNAIYAWGLTIGGALFLAGTFAILSSHIEGGPFVYVEEAFGPEVAFVVMWSYLSHIAPMLGAPIVAPLVSVLLLWLMWLVNASGARSAGILQVVTTVLKALP